MKIIIKLTKKCYLKELIRDSTAAVLQKAVSNSSQEAGAFFVNPDGLNGTPLYGALDHDYRDYMQTKLYEIPLLRQKTDVFRDRKHAGQVLAEMLHEWKGSEALILAVPSGGIPVAVEVAGALGLALDVAVVSKILLPWTTEAGFGAVGFDGSVWVNQEYVDYYGLDRVTVEQQTQATLQKVQRRVKLFRGERPWPDLKNRAVILVDDGIAAGSTLRVAIQSLHNSGAVNINVAVPTAHEESLTQTMDRVNVLYCANIRSGPQFAVAAAYQLWDDVDESEAVEMLNSYRTG